MSDGLSKGEKRANKIGSYRSLLSSVFQVVIVFVDNVASGASSSHVGKFIRSEFATQLVGVIQSQIGDFEQSSKMIVSMLQAAADMHPWISCESEQKSIMDS